MAFVFLLLYNQLIITGYSGCGLLGKLLVTKFFQKSSPKVWNGSNKRFIFAPTFAKKLAKRRRSSLKDLHPTSSTRDVIV